MRLIIIQNSSFCKLHWLLLQFIRWQSSAQVNLSEFNILTGYLIQWSGGKIWCYQALRTSNVTTHPPYYWDVDVDYVYLKKVKTLAPSLKIRYIARVVKESGIAGSWQTES